jgi:hypothetical protein
MLMEIGLLHFLHKQMLVLADDTQFNYSSATFRIGSTTGGSYDFDGYLAEFNQVDGTALTPSTFGLTDTSTGRWIPKTLTGITYGTNGFRLKFGFFKCTWR